MLEYLKDKWRQLRNKFIRAHRSMTIRFNSAVGVLVLALPYLQDQMPLLAAYLPADLYRDLMLLIVLGNIMLRFKTKKCLSEL